MSLSKTGKPEYSLMENHSLLEKPQMDSRNSNIPLSEVSNVVDIFQSLTYWKILYSLDRASRNNSI